MHLSHVRWMIVMLDYFISMDLPSWKELEACKNFKIEIDWSSGIRTHYLRHRKLAP